jgi:transmembrane 9 superfamily protein 3
MDLINLGLGIKFRHNTPPSKAFCTTHLNEHHLIQFQYAIRNGYASRWYIDNLPVFGRVGKIMIHDKEVKETELNYLHDKGQLTYYLFTQFDLSFSYNQNQIIHINLTHSNPVELPKLNSGDGLPITFSYSTQFNPTKITFDNRFDRFLDTEFFEHKVGVSISSICGLSSTVTNPMQL